MKDKELKERFSWLQERVGKLEAAEISVRFCSACEKDTIHQFHPRRTLVYVIRDQWSDFYRCLNCGTDWMYSTETVATKYKPPKGG